ncbi:MAG: T9SS type A sorting domain-containing protein [Ignavibacteria bacterium]|nr:T9SS type A sorting domain-containing protein [Ignavibacteria bacterium]
MKKSLLLLFVLLLSINRVFSQTQDTITIKLYLLHGLNILEIATGKVVEGQEYLLPQATLQPPFNAYQYYYNAIVGSKFYIEEGGLNQNVTINILFEMPPQIPWIINGKRVWFFATFEVEGFSGQDFYFQNNKSAVLEIPRTAAFDGMIQQLGFTPGTTWHFSYFKQGVGFVNLNISTINQPDKVICKLRHFSEVAGSTQSELSVEELITSQVPTDFELKQNYPNPFNSSTTIEYGISYRSFVRLSLLNSLGEVVATLVEGVRESGVYRYKLTTDDLPSGIYIYKLETNNKVLTRKMILIK